jgi:hypothetical protein
MRIDIAIGRSLRIEPVEAKRQRDVLDDVRKVPGVKGMAIVQRALPGSAIVRPDITSSPAKLV